MSCSVEVCLLTDSGSIDHLLEAIEPLNDVVQVRCLPKLEADAVKRWYLDQSMADPRLMDQINAIQRYLYQSGSLADSLLIIDCSVEISSLFAELYRDLQGVLVGSEVDCVLLAQQGGMAEMTPLEHLGEWVETDLNWNLYTGTDKTTNTAAVWLKRNYAVRCLEMLSDPLDEVEGVVAIHNWARNWIVEPPVMFSPRIEPISYPIVDDDETDIWTLMEIPLELVSWLTFGVKADSDYTQLMQHVLTLSRALEISDDDGFVITEESTLLADNYSEIMDELMDKMPDDALVVLLTHTVTDWTGIQRVPLGGEGVLTHLLRPHQHVYGTFGYWISREWAQECLKMYNRPLRTLCPRQLNPRAIVYTDQTYMLQIPIIYRTDTVQHRKYFSYYGLE